MSTDAYAELCYGARVPDDLLDKINAGEIEAGEGLDFTYAGGYEQIAFISIEESCVNAGSYNDGTPVKPPQFVVGQDWNDRIVSWFCAQGINEIPEPGWWLCARLC